MGHAAFTAPMTAQDFLAWDAHETLRHEFVRGKVFLREGAEERHVTALMNVAMALRNHLRGVTPEGKVYTIGRNVFREYAELAGSCFSPDGSTLFVNIYWPGITLAITGPWSGFRS